METLPGYDSWKLASPYDNEPDYDYCDDCDDYHEAGDHNPDCDECGEGFGNHFITCSDFVHYHD